MKSSIHALTLFIVLICIGCTTSLIRSAYKGELQEVRKLIEQGVDVNLADTDGATPLIMASQNGHAKVVQMLLAARADVNKGSATGGVTPLIKASNNGHTGIVMQLIMAKAEINAADKVGWTALHYASYKGYTDIVMQLITAKADVNAADKDGVTPLQIASEFHHAKTVKLLKEHGAK